MQILVCDGSTRLSMTGGLLGVCSGLSMSWFDAAQHDRTTMRLRRAGRLLGFTSVVTSLLRASQRREGGFPPR